MKKFELDASTETVFFGRKFFRVKALMSFGNVEKGDLGGYVEKESNLSQDGNAWVSGNALVSGNARVYGNAEVYGGARVYGDADLVWFSKVGSEYGTLTVFKSKTEGEILVTRGCFLGTVAEFLEKSREVHDDKTRIEYELLIKVAQSRLGVIDITKD